MKLVNTFISVALATLIISGQCNASTSIGAYVDHDGWNVETIKTFNLDSARTAATINVFSSFDHNWKKQLKHQASNIVERGATPMITFMPYQEAAPEANVLEAIIEGKHDDYLQRWISGFQTWQSSYPEDKKPRIALRFAHEFNGIWYPWGDKPDALVAAWRYVHRLFETAGVNDSIDWVWCANNVDVDSYNDITRYYPGADVVDWLAIDGYNFGSNYTFTRWKSFDETFSLIYVEMVKNFPGKPIMLAEVSSAEPHDLPNKDKGQDGNDEDAGESKDAWIKDMMVRIKSSYPAIKSVIWFNTNKELNWALNMQGNTGLNAFNEAVRDEYFASSMESSKVINKLPSILGTPVVADSMPEVVGTEMLAIECDGIRHMNRDTLREWRLGGILPL